MKLRAWFSILMMVLFIGTGFGKDTPDLTKNSDDVKTEISQDYVKVSQTPVLVIDIKGITEQISPSYLDVQKATNYIHNTFTFKNQSTFKAKIKDNYSMSFIANRKPRCNTYNKNILYS